MKIMTYTESRAHYAEVLDQVVNDREEIVITRQGHESVVIMALDEYESLMETVYLMQSPANARRGELTMLKVLWTPHAWNDYVWWQFEDRKTLTRINALIADIQRNGNEGIGKPEPLRYEYTGFWSRRIDGRNRLVYRISEDTVEIVACRFHYGQ